MVDVRHPQWNGRCASCGAYKSKSHQQVCWIHSLRTLSNSARLKPTNYKGIWTLDIHKRDVIKPHFLPLFSSWTRTICSALTFQRRREEFPVPASDVPKYSQGKLSHNTDQRLLTRTYAQRLSLCFAFLHITDRSRAHDGTRGSFGKLLHGISASQIETGTSIFVICFWFGCVTMLRLQK